MLEKSQVKAIEGFGLVVAVAGISAIGPLASPARATALNQPISQVSPRESASFQNIQPLKIAQVDGCPRA